MRQRMTLVLSLDAPRRARHFFDRYQDEIEASLLDDLRIASSELVTNAVAHSGRPEGDPIEMVTTVSAEMIRVQVTDQGDGPAPLQPRSLTPPSGLAFVGLLSDRWSGETIESFRVWFEIDTRTNGLIRRKN